MSNNRRNGYSSKTMKSDHGTFELDVPRDRNGNFEPEIVKKNQTSMTSEIEDKILSLFALGNSYSQIAKYIEDFYCVGCIRRNNSDSQPIYIRTLCRS
ncbi:transposase [Aliarcobacter cryaerophilus]|uniref:transposase n=1 Tax=Aliarcobacter cryaerophilus TaxID=28198 RepID=UPI0021B219A3|nr:transposase [Aliarcobacter cryaerophilus]MCT7464913.1 transposase [Aliarcobacter cryaerophilus]